MICIVTAGEDTNAVPWKFVLLDDRVTQLRYGCYGEVSTAHEYYAGWWLLTFIVGYAAHGLPIVGYRPFLTNDVLTSTENIAQPDELIIIEPGLGRPTFRNFSNYHIYSISNDLEPKVNFEGFLFN